GDGNFRASLGEMAGDGAPDSASGTCDDGDLIFQFRHDDFSSKALNSSDKRQQLVQVLNSADPGVLNVWLYGRWGMSTTASLFSATSRQFSCRSSTNSSTLSFPISSDLRLWVK